MKPYWKHQYPDRVCLHWGLGQVKAYRMFLGAAQATIYRMPEWGEIDLYDDSIVSQTHDVYETKWEVELSHEAQRLAAPSAPLGDAREEAERQLRSADTSAISRVHAAGTLCLLTFSNRSCAASAQGPPSARRSTTNCGKDTIANP